MSELPSHSWAHKAGGICAALRHNLSHERLGLKLHVPFDDVQFLENLFADKRSHALDYDEMLAAISGVVDERLINVHAPLTTLQADGAIALRAAQQVRAHRKVLEQVDLNLITPDEVFAKHAKLTEGKPPKVREPQQPAMKWAGKAAEKPHSNFVNHTEQVSNHGSAMEKIGLAASLLVGAVSLVGAWKQLSNAVTKDEDGHRHVDSTNLTWGMVNLALAAVNGAFAYYAVKGMGRGASVA